MISLRSHIAKSLKKPKKKPLYIIENEKQTETSRRTSEESSALEFSSTLGTQWLRRHLTFGSPRAESNPADTRTRSGSNWNYTMETVKWAFDWFRGVCHQSTDARTTYCATNFYTRKSPLRRYYSRSQSQRYPFPAERATSSAEKG